MLVIPKSAYIHARRTNSRGTIKPKPNSLSGKSKKGGCGCGRKK